MIAEIKTCRVADTLINFQADQINQGLRIQLAQDSLITVQGFQINNAEASVAVWGERYSNQVEATAVERREKRKWKLIAVTAGVVVVLQFLFR